MLSFDAQRADARRDATAQRARAAPAAAAARTSRTLDDLRAALWLRGYDAAWLDRDWAALERRLAPDVALLSADMKIWLAGQRAVLAHLQAMLAGARVHEYNATDIRGRSHGAIGIIRFRWRLDWTFERRRRHGSGCEVLVLRATHDDWQLLRRLPLPATGLRKLSAWIRG